MVQSSITVLSTFPCDKTKTIWNYYYYLKLFPVFSNVENKGLNDEIYSQRFYICLTQQP